MNCFTGDETTRAIIVSQLEAPAHINFPGFVQYTVNMSFTRKINEVYVDFDITRYFLGFPLRLPCKAPTIVGTWYVQVHEALLSPAEGLGI